MEVASEEIASSPLWLIDRQRRLRCMPGRTFYNFRSLWEERMLPLTDRYKRR
jgi:hypothetical protein